MTETYRAPRTSEKKIVFDGAPVIVLKKPKLWPGGEGGRTEVQAVWLRGEALKPVSVNP
jgi:hypothetical protein